MDLASGLLPRHRLPLTLPRAWPGVAQNALRTGATWLHQGGPGGWGGDLLALPAAPRLEARWDGSAFTCGGNRGPWQALAAQMEASEHPWIGAASYELACFEAGLPFQPPPENTLGMAWSGILEAIHVSEGSAELWGWSDHAPDGARVVAQLSQGCSLSRTHLEHLRPAWTSATHRQEVENIQKRIAEGSFYVANLCVPFHSTFHGDPVTLALARFREARPPFGAFMPLEGTLLLCLGMERVLGRNGEHLWTEPIKGSALLTGEMVLDEAAGALLMADPKELAEHTMIVDLLRNDLGRVAATDTVRVASLMERRIYPTVQHLVSRVEARLRPGTGLAELLRAVLPGGSVTGAPKHAVCAHLAETEAGPRGFYCGALGWIGPGGTSLDLALPIRTAQLQGTELTYWAGGGITRRSDADREWEELLLKTRVMGPHAPASEESDSPNG